MQDLVGRTAVVTGAASGIGRALAERFAAQGMRVALADVEKVALEETTESLAATGAEVMGRVTDVSSRSDVDALAAEVTERFGVPHVLCNNAGVSGGGGPLWSTTERDWSWVLGVNLMGVVHGLQAFLPAMVASGQPGHVVNTSSVLGLSTGGGSIYGVTKHAVTRLTEGLWYDLQAAAAPIGVSVLCPGMVATRIVSAGRNRPEHLRNEVDEGAAAAAARRTEAAQARFLESGMSPEEVADQVVDAVLHDRFYVLTHPEMIKPMVEARFRAILDDTSPPPARPLLDPRRIP